MKRIIDCFTFYNELDMLELRLTELYDVVDKFVLVEADRTQKGNQKKYFFEENKLRYEKFLDKIIHVKLVFPEHLDIWGREKYQRNSFMPSLYSLSLSDNDVIIISDVDEIPDSNTIIYIRDSYDMKGLYKLEMDHYWGSIYNKMSHPEKWYHAKVVDWGTLKSRTPDECRLDFTCQWWQKGGWHLSYFGGPDVIINKINNMAHQELNHDQFKIRDEIIRKIREGIDIFDEWRRFTRIDPLENPYLPKNWNILEKLEADYSDPDNRKDLLLCAGINLDLKDIRNFVESFREYNKDADIFFIVEPESSTDKIEFLKNNGVSLLSTNSIKFIRTQPNNTRFIKISDFLKESESNYKNVLLSDVSDVVFQGDPFANLYGEFIISPEEDEEKTIEDDYRFNGRWIKQCFGDSVYEEIKNNKILCCGTVIGSIRNIKIYVDSICKEMFRMYNENSPNFGDIMDQGIHNYLFYKTPEIFKNPIIKKNGDYIATIGITLLEYPHKIKYLGDKISVNGLIPSIVHQYNRSDEMKDFYSKNIENLKKKRMSILMHQ